MGALLEWWNQCLGLQTKPEQLSFIQISARGLIIFAVALLLVRLSDRRSLSKKSPFDIVLLVIVGGILSRAINGSASFFGSIGAAAVLVFLHRILAFVCYRSPALRAAIKGHPVVLVRDGEWERAALRRRDLSPEDVLEDLRLSAKEEEVEKIKTARLEVSGDISFVLADPKVDP